MVSLDSQRYARIIFIAAMTSTSPTAIVRAMILLITYRYSESLKAESWSSLSSTVIRFGGGCEARRRVQCQRRAVVAGVVAGSKGIGRLIGCLVAQCPKFGICSVSVFRAALELRRFAQRRGSQALAMGGIIVMSDSARASMLPMIEYSIPYRRESTLRLTHYG